MIAGVLELQLLAEMASLSTDMKRAERVVQDSTDKMGRQVGQLESAFGKLGGTLSLAVAFDQVRRLTDDYQKLTAQLRIATHSQAEYAAGLADVRRISTAAQADILSTTLLYTRLTNALSQHGATQKQVSSITESVSLGLKAYGATATEASSAMLQLSQAFGANRLGGEEFRAVSEAMPNMMKILATSMGVPLSALKALSAEGKITSEVMMKAWDNPAVIDALRKQADMTRTITGELVVFRNNLKMLVGEFMGASGSTSGITSAIRLMSDAVLLLGKNLDQVVTILGAYLGYLALLQFKSVLAWGQSRLMVMAHTDAIRMDAVVNAAAAEAKVADLAATQAVIVAERVKAIAIMQSTVATRAKSMADNEATLAQLNHAKAIAQLSGHYYIIRTIEAELIVTQNALTASTLAYNKAVKGVAELGAAQAAVMQAQVVAGVELAAANRAVAASTITLGTSVATAAGIISASVSAAVLANPIGAAVLAIGAIALAIVNWETIVKGAKATFDWFGNMINALSFGAQAGSIQLGKFFAQLMLGIEHSTGKITTAKYREMWAQIDKDAEEATIKLVKHENDKIDHEKLAAAQQFAADRADWEKLTNTKAQQRQAEIAALNEQYLKIITGQTLNQAQQLVEAERYNVALANINNKYGKAAAKEAKKINEEAMKHAEELSKIQLSIDAASARAVASSIRETEALQKKIEQEQYETSIIGKTKEQIALLEAARYDHTTAILEETLALNDSFGVNTQEIEQLRKQIALRKELKQTMVAQAAGQAAHAEVEAQRKANEKLWHDIDGFAHTAFDNIFDKGKNVFEEIGKVIKKSILDMLYQMTIKKWVFQISGVAAGGGASSLAGAADMAGGGGAGGGIGGWLSAGASAYTAVTGALTASISQGVAQAGAAMWNAGAKTIGNSIMGNVAPITTALSYVGAGIAGIALGTMIGGDKKVIGLDSTSTAALGAAIGLAITAGNPLGALVGGIAGGVFNAAFGKGPKQSGTTTLAGQFSDQGFAGQYQTPWSQSGGWFSSGDSGVDVQGVGAAQQAALSSVVAGTQFVFGNLIAASGDAQRSITGWTFAFNRQVATEAQSKQLIADMADSMGAFLIPSLTQFKKEGENLADTAVRMKDTFILTDAVLWMVGGTFGSIGLASMGMRDNLVNLLGGLSAANSAMQGYYAAFYSDTERLANSWAQMMSSLSRLGFNTIPKTNSEFRLLVEAQDLSTQAGQETFAALIALAPAFDQITKMTDTLNGSMSSLATDYFASKIEYDRLIGRVQGGSTKTPTTNAELLEELKAMRQELAALRDASNATAKNTKQTADTLRNVSQDGTAFTTVPA